VTWSILLSFAATLLAAAMTPGPAITAVVARVLSRGPKRAIPYAIGIITGDLTWLSVAVTGLSVIANSFESAFTIVRYCGAAHLLYLAYRLWGAIPDSGEPHTEKHIKDLQKETLGGLALELGNPKTIAFYVALFPNLLELTEASSWDYLLLFAFTLAIYLFAFGTYILLAVRSRRILRSASAATLVNRGASVAIAGAAIVVATRR